MSGDEVKTLWTLEDGARSSVSAKRSEAKVTLRVTGGHTEREREVERTLDRAEGMGVTKRCQPAPGSQEDGV